MQTKQLLGLRDRAYRVNGGRIPEDRQESYGISLWDYGGFVSLADIKRELATRPHVPNKAERRLARQTAAGRRRGRHRGRRDR